MNEIYEPIPMYTKLSTVLRLISSGHVFYKKHTITIVDSYKFNIGCEQIVGVEVVEDLLSRGRLDIAREREWFDGLQKNSPVTCLAIDFDNIKCIVQINEKVGDTFYSFDKVKGDDGCLERKHFKEAYLIDSCIANEFISKCMGKKG